MGAVKKHEMERLEAEQARLDAEFAIANPDLIADGWDREDWEAFEYACDKND
jgi:hypothetical protein